MDEPTLAQVQRLRVRFGADGALRYVSHLDVMRVWERVCKRAGLPLSHSQGFSPRPKIALAAPPRAALIWATNAAAADSSPPSGFITT